MVTGFDRVYSGTDIVIWIVDLKTLKAGVEDYIKIGVSLTYYNYGGVKGYIYEPTGFVVGNTTAATSPVPINNLVVSETSTNFVGDLVNYTFSGVLGAGFASVSTNDYVVVEFEKHVFEGYFSQNLEALCSLATNSKCYSFGLSNIVYFQPSSMITATGLSFTLNNIINSAYSIEYVDETFKVFTVVGNKVNALGTTSLLKFSKPTGNISALITQVGSLYGGEAGIRYWFEFKLGHNLPKNGLISIQFSKVYQSLFELNSQCILLGKLAKTTAVCEIIHDHLAIIYPNGEFLDSQTTYQLAFTNITNPNQDLSSDKFVIKTFHTDNIYEQLMIARSSFNSPEIIERSVKKCETFDVKLTAVNAFFESEYEITLICTTYIKEASELKLYLDWKPDLKNSACSSESDSLYSYDCKIMNEFQGTKNYTYMSIYLREIPPQKLISISVNIKNGQLGTYTILGSISYKGFTYLSTKSN